MKVSIKRIIATLIIIVLILIIIPKEGYSNFSLFEILLFLLITIICINDISNELSNHSYSLNMIHYIFILFFYVFAPVVQIYFDYRPWGLYLDLEHVEYTLSLIVLWLIFYKIANVVQKKIKTNQKNKNSIIVKIPIGFMIFITILSIGCSAYLISKVGLTSLFSRATSGIKFDSSNGEAQGLIINSFIKITILYSTVISYVYIALNKKGYLFLIINVLLLLITHFPTGISRNSAGIIYLGLIIIFHYINIEKFKNKMYYFLIFIVGFTIIFPAISTFRNNTWEEADFGNEINEVIKNITYNYKSADYDAFSMIIQTEKYIDKNDIKYGKQLIGNLLFFVPRKIWESKPTGSGYTIFSDLNYSFKNVSCPLLAEGLINFGIIGVILYAFITGYIVSLLDQKYWNIMNKQNNKFDYLTLLYPFLLPSFFFMLRGDFLSTYSYMFSYIFIFYLYTKIITINSNNKEGGILK